MKANKFDDNKQLLFLGDIHGNWRYLLYKIKEANIIDANIVSVGDLGIGFNLEREAEYKQWENLNTLFKNRNINFYGIRGNHDDPSFFKGSNRISLEHFELIEDYSVYTYQNKQMQFIGGAVSIDRTGRTNGVSYWEEEGVIFNKKACNKVDALITHTAPSWCFPQQFNEMVYGWARQDAYLLEDLTDERAVMDKIFKLCSPSLHLYGHFHSSWTEEINECRHKLLNIDELWSLENFNFNK